MNYFVRHICFIDLLCPLKNDFLNDFLNNFSDSQYNQYFSTSFINCTTVNKPYGNKLILFDEDFLPKAAAIQYIITEILV